LRPIEDYIFNPDRSIGGAIIPLVGPPGVGKTVGLSQIAMQHFKNNHKVLSRGTKQAQWVWYLANGYPITIWNNENIENFEAFISADQDNEEEKVDLEEEADVRINEWKTPAELVSRLHSNRINIINVPGLEGDTANTKYHLYYFRKIFIDLLQALIERKDLSFHTFIADEIGDLLPSQNELRDPFYSLVAEDMPKRLAQLRKQNCFMFGAGHSTHDMNYLFWKVKSNSIVYMSNANVKKSITPEIDQSYVSRMDRGEFAMPPKDKDHFKMPKQPETLDFVPESETRELRLDWESDAPDLLRQNWRKVAAKKLNLEHGMNQNTVAEVLGVSQSQVSKWVNS